MGDMQDQSQGFVSNDGRIGRDEWAAQEERRRTAGLRRAGVRQRPARTWLGLDMRARLAIVAGLAAWLPLLTSNPYLLRVAGLTGLYVALSLGLNLVAGMTGLLDLGYAAFYGVGAYAYALVSSPQFDLHWATWAALALALASTALLGLLLGLPSLRLRGDYLAIVTLGFGQVAVLLFTNLDRLDLSLFGLEIPLNITNGPNGIISVDDLSLFGWQVQSLTEYYWVILLFAVLVYLAVHHLDRSRIGRAWRAIREDELAAQAMGVNAGRLKVLAFSVGAAIAGLSGALLAAWQGAVFPPNFDMNLVIMLYAMIVLGGVGSVPGTVAGAIILALLPEALRDPAVARLLFYGALVAVAVRSGRRDGRGVLGVAGGVILLGLVMGWAMPALFPGAFVGGTDAVPSGGLLASVPPLLPQARDAMLAGNVAFVLTAILLVGAAQARGWARPTLLVPAIYGLVYTWEVRLMAEPSVTRMLIFGALLVLMMNRRPQGLFGERWVQTAQN